MEHQVFHLFFTVSVHCTGAIQSLSSDVRLCVCLCVCVSVPLVEFFLNVSLRPLPKDQNKIVGLKNIPQGKVYKGHCLRFKDFCADMVKNCLENIFCHGHSFAWTHITICMEAQRNLHGHTTEFAWAHYGICMEKQQNLFRKLIFRIWDQKFLSIFF